MPFVSINEIEKKNIMKCFISCIFCFYFGPNFNTNNNDNFDNLHYKPFVVLIFAIFSFMNNTIVGPFNNLVSLFTYPTSSRYKNIRPRIENSQATEVFVDFYLLYPQGINAVEGTFSLTGFFNLTGMIHTCIGMQWTITSTPYMHVPPDSVWTPPLANTGKRMQLLGIHGISACVLHTGNITYYLGQHLLFSFSIDTTYFPFDKQKCDWNILVWCFGSNDVKLNLFYSTVQTLEYIENNEWDLETTSVEIINSVTSLNLVSYALSFRRRPSFLFVTIIIHVPTILLSFDNFAVFFLPQESDERIGFSIRRLLAVVVYLPLLRNYYRQPPNRGFYQSTSY